MIYYEKVCHENNISRGITEVYHEHKPTMEEIFGKYFIKVEEYITRQEQIYGDKYDDYESLDENLKALLDDLVYMVRIHHLRVRH